jgi:hypothetical protein
MMDNDRPKPSAGDPSAMDDLIRRTKQFLVGTASDSVERVVGPLFHTATARVTSHLVAASIFGASAVFLMVAGSEGLKTAGLAPWLAYLTLGLVGVLSASVVLMRAKPRPA